MKPMQKFSKKMSSKRTTLTSRGRCLTALMRLSVDVVGSLSASDPWLIWSAKTAVRV
jgi:hypothetical protein